MTPLPKDLPGIPPSHRRYINHAYSLILRAVQAKLKVYNDLGFPRPSDADLGNYLDATRAIQKQLRDEPAPESMKPFRDDVIGALDLQMTFFTKAFSQR